ncbi:MAG: protein-glutamate O-methyltransferase CheR [Phenylobacterium sp.]|uniref:CheR family methyltransferase n=1 Tax=Phenylobacterium sp. TaxID=1871053 RepID=UPI001A5851C9|nr:protein-glutamate O-methyltransferase CheR [Phenylobacterium sp.]MBL8771624.1 protein-glutamate O-methyltransferase CheR [Phenylobacterium sp.]
MIPVADLDFVAALCRARAGLRVDPEKGYLVESRVAPVARREGFASPEAFIAAVRADGDARLAWSLVEAMVLPETEFFRDRQVFDALARDVLPALARARAGQPVRVWSAACGAGQEIYSLAMLVAEDPTLAGQVELFASDLSERSLEKAQAGLFSQFEVQRGLPARTLVRHFEKAGESFALSPRIRQMVRWRRVNLMDDLARFGQFDVLICRNLLTQLAPEAQAAVVGRLKRALAPGGRLVLGLREEAGGELTPMGGGLGLFALPGDAVRTAA